SGAGGICAVRAAVVAARHAGRETAAARDRCAASLRRRRDAGERGRRRDAGERGRRRSPGAGRDAAGVEVLGTQLGGGLGRERAAPVAGPVRGGQCGEHTDVVGKEMYTFTDRGGDSLTLRPEATAGIVRALISNGLLRGQRHKLWCLGPMFRHEAPQAGRYRQFWQVDVEAVGWPGPDVDAELIALGTRLWERLGIASGLRLEINSLGTPESRRAYRERLVEYLHAHEARLDADSRRRLTVNPLRVLDSKNPQMLEIIAGAPLLSEQLDPESRAHFDALCDRLRAVGVS